MEKVMAGATTVSEMATSWVVSARVEEAPIVEALKCGNEDAYNWLIAHFHQPVYSMVYRLLRDPADAADTTQEVFLKVYRGIKRFKGDSSLKTWIYRIAIHEASNQRRWWSRHKQKETSMEEDFGATSGESNALLIKDTLTDGAESPFELMAHEEVRARVEMELRQVPEPYRTTVILRDIEGMSYEEISETLETSLGTVKSRLVRGRDCLRKRLEPFVRNAGPQLGLDNKTDTTKESDRKGAKPAEVTLR